MVTNVVFFSGMVLDNGLVFFKKQVFNEAHHPPGGGKVRGADRHMIPSACIAHDNHKGEAFVEWDLEGSVVP